MSKKINVLVADDHQIVREGIITMLSHQKSFNLQFRPL